MSKLAQELIEKEKVERSGYLNISCCGLYELPDISELTWLYMLDVSSNQIEDFNCIEGLVDLKFLYLSNNAIKDLKFLQNLRSLINLDLSTNKISEVDYLENLKSLTTLDLNTNEVKDLQVLEKLTKLVKLDLSNNEIESGTYIKNLKRLSILNLSNNQLSSAGFLKKLTNLVVLDLSHNQINSCRFLRKLKNLEALHLNNNLLTGNISLDTLPNLNQIDLSYNGLKDLSQFSYFFRHKDMKVIWEEPYLTYEGELNVKDNPLENPPIGIVIQGNEAVLEYFYQKNKIGATPLLEAKLILLGDGRSGKTSLANRLLGKALPSEADRTKGVDIIIGEYCFGIVDGYQFKLHIWDFAGQDKYKTLHQFFYTEGAVYVLVADSGNAGTDYDDWLQTAQLFGDGSPLLVVLNEFREDIGYGLFDPEHWQKRFPGLLKEHFLVNLLSEKNLPSLKNSIHHFAQSLPHTQLEYPKNWAAIRQELERRRDENFISFNEYLKICQKNDLPEKESALILSGILHKIGVCLHYQKSDLLRQHVILKNEWATEAVYKILEDSKIAEKKKGFFDWDDLRRIWSDETYSEMRPQLLELMQQFKMAYPLPNSQEFVAPPLLPPAPPHSWEFPTGEFLELFVEYEFLPKALLTQFIVSRHTDIDEGRTLVWRNGVVLRWPEALGEVIKTKSQGRDAFNILTKGNNRKGLLTAILKTFRDLHSEYKGIKAAEIIPCPCNGCRSGKNKQHYFDFENLKNRLEKRRHVVECDRSLEEIELIPLLDDLLLFERLSIGKPVVMKNNSITKLNATQPSPLAFFSYSEHDAEYLKEFQKHLRPLGKKNKIRFWDNLEILPGEERDAEIKRNLNTADIIFLLLSPDFLNTEYIWDIEMEAAIRRHEAGTARVIPIKLRPCAWEDTPFSKLQGLPRMDQVISTAEDQDAIWLEVVKEIKGILEDWR